MFPALLCTAAVVGEVPCSRARPGAAAAAAAAPCWRHFIKSQENKNFSLVLICRQAGSCVLQGDLYDVVFVVVVYGTVLI